MIEPKASFTNADLEDVIRFYRAALIVLMERTGEEQIVLDIPVMRDAFETKVLTLEFDPPLTERTEEALPDTVTFAIVDLKSHAQDEE